MPGLSDYSPIRPGAPDTPLDVIQAPDDDLGFWIGSAGYHMPKEEVEAIRQQIIQSMGFGDPRRTFPDSVAQGMEANLPYSARQRHVMPIPGNADEWYEGPVMTYQELIDFVKNLSTAPKPYEEIAP